MTLPTQNIRTTCKSVACVLICLISSIDGPSQDPFPDYAPVYQDDIVARVDILIAPDSLAIILAPGNEESEEHYHATFIFNNGTISDTLENAGLQLRGNTSRYADKKSFQVSLNKFVPGRTWYGVEKINLNGEHNDPTVSRSKVCWDLLRAIGIPAPRSNHVRLYINGAYKGLYANVEHIDEEFVQTRFGNKDGNLYKCLWPADLQYLGSDPDLYKLMSGDRRVYELKTNEETDDYSDLAHFIDILNNTPIQDLQCSLEQIFNVNSFLKCIAFDILSGNWDGPLYNKNNFFLYHNLATGKFEYLPYDLDNTFGIDWFGVNWVTRNIYSWGHPDEPRPLYWRILEIPEYKDRLSYYLEMIINEVYKESVLFSRLDSLKTLLAPSVAEDIYYTLDYGFSIDDFHKGFGQTLPYFHTPFGIKPFIASRRSATINQLQVNDIAPIISEMTEEISGKLSIGAFVEDDNAVVSVYAFLEWNADGNILNVQMHDDGQHLDGDAGDGRYGATVTLPDTLSTLRYYLLATDAISQQSRGPVCGYREHTIGSSAVTLVVNEFMASNESTIRDDHGEYEDWIELHNYGSESISLGGMYLTDNISNTTKWQIPDTTLHPGAYLLIWADDEEDEGALHSSIKLSAGGEYVGLFESSQNGNVLIDGIDFGEQQTDVSFGRMPNGSGPFITLHPTPGGANETITSTENTGNTIQILIYPNPVRDVLHIQTSQAYSTSQQILLLNVLGQIVMQKEWHPLTVFETGVLSPGIYFPGVESGGRVHILGRIVKE